MPPVVTAHRLLAQRRIVQVCAFLFWLSLPLGGLLQVDIAHVRLLIAGHPWPALSADLLPTAALARGAAPRWDLIAPVLCWAVAPVAFLAAAFLLTARYLGRVHCGYTCTYGFLAETGELLFRWARKPGPGRAGRLAAAWALVVGAAPFTAFVLEALFVSPRGVMRGLAGLDPAIAVPFAVLTTLAIVMGGVVRLRFCRYVCGVGLVQSLAWSTNPKALEVGWNPKPAADGSHGSMRDCTGCHGCRDVCPIGLDPRQPKRYMLACFQCSRCVDRCEQELHPLGKGAAIGFHLAQEDYPLPAQTVKAPALVAMARALQESEAAK